MNKVFVIMGPTSSGKTSLSVELCKKFNGEIISADSRQIFKEMDVGTGKVPIKTTENTEKQDDHWTFEGIPVWGYDLASPDQYFSGYDYALWALPKAKQLLEEGKSVFLVGGTGFYIDLFTNRVQPFGVGPDFELRKELETLDTSQLLQKLTSLNPEVLERIDPDNPARLMRAIEIEISKHKSPTPLPYLENVSFEFIGLTAPREILYERVDTWMETIWDKVVEETKTLLAKYADTRPLQGLIYKTATKFLNKEIAEEDAIKHSKFDLHKYIRRQQTYFKKNEEIVWFDITEDGFSKNVANHVESKLDG